MVMMMNYNKFLIVEKNNEEIDTYDDFHKKKIRDIDYYLKSIEDGKISKYYIKMLFHWSCVYDFNELAIKLMKYLNNRDVVNLSRSISKLKYEYFEEIVKKDNLYLSLNEDRDFYQYLMNSDDAVRKLQLFMDLGMDLSKIKYVFTTDVEVVKFFVENKIIDPLKKEKAIFSYQLENSLDVATQGKHSNTIKYLINEIKVPVTYRHIYNVIKSTDLDKDDINYLLSYLINDDITINNDYSYSNYATNDIDRRPISYYDVFKLLLKDDIDIKYMKKYIDKNIVSSYHYISSLLAFGSIRTKDKLSIAYYIINKYDKHELKHITEAVMRVNKDFWFKKFKENPNIMLKMQHVSKDILMSYEYQKLIILYNNRLLKNIKNNPNDRIMKEYGYLFKAERYNL